MAREVTVKKPEMGSCWRPFIDPNRWEKDVEKLIDDFFDRKTRTWWPQRRSLPAVLDIEPPLVDCYKESGQLVVKAELPWVPKQSIEFNVTDHTLTIKGEKKREEKIESENYYRSERSFGSFFRSLELPEDVDVNKVKAFCSNGVIEMRLPIAATAKSKTFKVEVEEGPIASIGQN
jgi:HSP20 family protein